MCFHAFLPESDQPMPVVVQIDARAKGAYYGKYFDFVSKNEVPSVKRHETWNARRSGYARIGIFTSGVKPLVATDKRPVGVADIMGFDVNSPEMPKHFCETVDMVNANGTYAQPPLQFMKRVVDWIYSQPKVFDASKIFLKGFSMSAGYGGKAFRCLSQKIAGAWTGGVPSVMEDEDCDKVRNEGHWPCFREERPVVYCRGHYHGDFKKKKNGVEQVRKNWDKSIECAAKEGIKATYFDFPGGAHYQLHNSEFWLQSCFGIGTFCNSDCEGKFLECMKKEMLSHDGKLLKTFEQFPKCMAEMDGSVGCKGCAATLKMLSQSEKPLHAYGAERFGESYPLGAPNPKPKTSICNAIKVWP